MGEVESLSIGIISVSELLSLNSDDNAVGQQVEKVLSSEKHFRILKTRRNIENMFKLKFLIEEWSDYENLDLIFVIGNAPSLALDNINKSLHCGNFNQYPHIKKLLLLNDQTGSSLFCRFKCYIYSRTLIMNLNLPLENFQSFFESVVSDILLARNLLKTIGEAAETSMKLPNNTKSKVALINVAERPRQSTFPMISVTSALECVLEKSNTLKTTWKSFADALGYVLAEGVLATEPYPPFNASIKDGYAILAQDESRVREVIGVVTPGCELDFDMKPGTCVRVSTGSAIPNKADAVIQVEDTAVAEKDLQGNEHKIEILKPVKHFQDIRLIGSDVTVGELLIPPKKKISAAEVGVLAVCGIQKVLVYDKPCVALLSTGDEVLEPNVPLKPGCIRDSNKSSLMSLLDESRIPYVDAGIAKDIAEDIKSRLAFAMEFSDIIVTTGSVSMGEKDMLKLVLEQDFEATIHFGRVHMKPGKPATFSTVSFNNKEKLVFSLPGNPVSAYVCFYIFVIPCIKKLMGFEEPQHTYIKVKIGHDIKLDERPEFYRVSLKPGNDSTFVAYSTGGQQSSRLMSMQNADALLVLPPKTSEQLSLKAGSLVDAIILKSI